MLKVEKVTNLLLVKMVRLVAPAEEAHAARKVLGGRFMKLLDVRFEVRPGEVFNLPFPFWTSYAVGEKVALADVARHPLGPRWTPLP